MYWLIGKVVELCRRHWVGLIEMLTCSWGLAHWVRDDARQEREADEAAAAVHDQVRRLAVEQGAAAAHLQVQQTYADEMGQLDRAQQDKVAEMAHDPAALARYIVEVTQTDKAPPGEGAT